MKDSPTQSHVLQLSHPPIPVVRIGIIGLGNRGLLTLQRYLQIEGIEINALCEIREGNLAKAQQLLKENNRPGATGYTGPEGWKKMCEHDELDIVFICTDWLMHTAMATFAMECNKHVAIEVPAAMSVEECWQLVDTAEKTRRHCIMLENCCYDPFALTTLNMARQGILGTIMHVEGAYIHDLRSMYFAEESEGGYHNHWGKRYSIEHTGNPYPTHGLGPACQILDIHRGDKMEYLVSMSTHQAGMSEYARKKFGKDSPEARQEYKLGDVNTTLIHTAKGKQSCCNMMYARPGLTAACKPYAVLLVLHKNTPCLASHWSPTETLLLKEKHWKKYYPAINILSAPLSAKKHIVEVCQTK